VSEEAYQGRRFRVQATEDSRKWLVSEHRDCGVGGNNSFLLSYFQTLNVVCENCLKSGAILMTVSNSFKVSFRLTRTREKAGKIKLSLFTILDWR